MVKLWDINNYSSGGFKDVPGKSSNQKVIGYPIPGQSFSFAVSFLDFYSLSSPSPAR